MKTTTLSRFRLTLFSMSATVAALAAPSPLAMPRILSIQVSGDGVTLQWTGGRPSFQLQSRASLEAPWQNVGQPTAETSATVPTTGQSAFFRVVSDHTARFEVVFDATWSAETHPGAWPAGGHWSGPVGGVHNDKVHFWAAGETASEGIRLMAERGQQATLASEIQGAINLGNAGFTMTAAGFGSPGRQTVMFPRATTREFPLLTLVSMIAPSPDWFVGVAGLSLLDAEGAWIDEQTVTVYGHDAGTDSGVDFSSPDVVTTPRGVVTRFDGYPALINGEIVPFGTFTVRRVE